ALRALFYCLRSGFQQKLKRLTGTEAQLPFFRCRNVPLTFSTSALLKKCLLNQFSKTSPAETYYFIPVTMLTSAIFHCFFVIKMIL
ncbi:TPA: hypothetical protein ACRRXW_002603, partial [Morganella morganii]